MYGGISSNIELLTLKTDAEVGFVLCLDNLLEKSSLKLELKWNSGSLSMIYIVHLRSESKVPSYSYIERLRTDTDRQAHPVSLTLCMRAKERNKVSYRELTSYPARRGSAMRFESVSDVSAVSAIIAVSTIPWPTNKQNKHVYVFSY